MLSLPQPPGRMESFDISNTGSSDIVASMVVYQGTRPLRSAYRRFQIKELTGGHPDDYASMQEVLRRRYVMGQNFSEIAEAMGVVQRRAYQLHRTAVEGMAVPKRA